VERTFGLFVRFFSHPAGQAIESLIRFFAFRFTYGENPLMRCPDCNHSQSYRGNSAPRCAKCGYQFIFRKQDDNITDYSLRQIVKRLSDDGQYAFTATQLALEICQFWRSKSGVIGGIVFTVLIALILFFALHWIASIIVLMVGISLTIWANQRQKITLPFHKASALVRRYHEAHPIAALADGAAFQHQNASEPEALSYAPERILVVERDDLVDMLVRNRFHLTSKTAVISRNGYPAAMFAACQNFMRDHPNTSVHLLHDASLAGFGMAAQLGADWRGVDLGISRQTLDSCSGKLPWLPTAEQTKVGIWSTQHAKMLSRNYWVPVDFVGPKPLMGLLSAAVIGGALALIAADAAWGESGVEIDYG
jgi:phosphotransferase system  glucose/maltose/N-acetylglucosamine-specific IIC component